MKSSCYFIATSWNERPISQHFRNLAKELAGRGHRVVLLISHQEKDIEDYESNPAIYTWPSFRPVKLRDAVFLYRLIRQYKPICAIANFGSVNLTMLLTWLLKVPLRLSWYHTLSSQIFIDQGVTKYSRWRLSFLRKRKSLFYRMATHLVANSKGARNDMVVSFGVNLSKVNVWHYYLRDPHLSSTTTLQKAGIFVCAGRFSPCKGQKVVIQALKRLAFHSGLHVIFIGDGPTKVFCQKLALELEVQDKCSFPGSLPHQEVLENMASAVAVLVPSLSEAFGLVNIESFAVGTPVIASCVGGIPEIVRDGLDGFLVSPGDFVMMAEKMKVLFEDPGLRKKMGKNARERFLAKFEQSRMVKKQADWLEGLVNSF